MDQQLLNFIDSMETIGALRNMDKLNPVVIEIEQPLTANIFTAISSIVEPSYLGIPINTTWVVLDPLSKYFKKALKMLSNIDPVSFVGGTRSPILDSGFTQSWVELSVYDDIFTDAQYYNIGGGAIGPIGLQGLQGLQGPRGAPGNTPVVDYSYLVAQVVAAIPVGKTLVSIAIVGASSVNEGSNNTYSVNATFSDASVQLLSSPVVFTADANIGTITVGGSLTAPVTSINISGNIQASYTYGGVTKSASKAITVVSKTLSSIAISGAASVPETTNSTYVATATYSDGTSGVVTAAFTADVAIGTISGAGILSASTVAANTVGSVHTSFTFRGITQTASKAITVTNVVQPVYPYYGVANLPVVKNAAFILGLTGRGSIVDLVSTFTLNSGAAGSATTMFFAYPKSYGLATFEDQSTIGFFGGWDGATGDPTAGAMGPLTVTGVMENGVATDFYLYQTDFPGLGSVTWKTTHKV